MLKFPDDGIVQRFYHELHAVDPRDRNDCLWRISPDVYESLCALFPNERYPQPPRLVPVDEPRRAPQPDDPGLMLGREVFVDPDLPPDTIQLDVDDAITRAIKRAERAGHKNLNIMPAPVFELAPLPPPPDVTLKALLRKWRGRLLGDT